MRRFKTALMPGSALLMSLTLAGCQTDGSGTKSVTCSVITYVYPSRKDTAPTVRANVLNNEALKGVGCPETQRPKK